MSEQSEMMDRVERLAYQAGLQLGLANSPKQADPVKPVVDAEIVRKLVKAVENSMNYESDVIALYAATQENNVLFGDLRKLYEALK